MQESKKVYCRSDIGKHRKNNEDIAYFSVSPYGEMLFIADGMGGHRKGEVASKIACDTFSYFFLSNRKQFTLKSARKTLLKALNKANKEINNLSKTSPYKELGTTVVSCIIFSLGAYIISVGDSRLYTVKDDKLTQITVDQTNIEFYKEIGKMDVFENPSSVRKLLISALGINPDIEDYEEMFIKKDDFDKIFLCSDGINSVLKDDEIKEILLKDMDTEKKVEEVISSSLKKNVMDNVAVVLWEK